MQRRVVVLALAVASLGFGVSVQGGEAEGKTLANANLVYFPVPPCRIVDTRIATVEYAGRIAAGTRRSFSHSTDLLLQGGSAASCLVPREAEAIAVTLTAVGALGPGNLRAWEYLGAVPNASVVNYASGLNLANTTILPVCGVCGRDFNVQADGSDVHLVADVVGYFMAPLREPLSCQTLKVNGTVPANSPGSLTTPTCPAGTTLTGGGIDTNFSSAEVWVFKSAPTENSDAWSCEMRNLTAGPWVFFDCYAICCGSPGRDWAKEKS